MDVPYPLFIQRNSSQKLFANSLQQELGVQADVNTIELWEPDPPLLIGNVEKKVKEMMPNGLQDFVKKAQHPLPLSTILGGKEEKADIIHIIVTRAIISLNWCFSSSGFSITDIRVAEIPRHLFNRPSEDCQKLFSDLLQSKFKFRADPNTIQFLTPRKPLPVTEMEERKDQLLKNGLQNFVKKAQLALSLSTILEGKEKTLLSSIFLCAERADKRHKDEDLDELGDLPESKRFKSTVAATSKRTALADDAKLTNYYESQKSIATRIYDGHYPPHSAYSTIAPPIELYHHIFNRFLGLVENRAPTNDVLKTMNKDLKDTRKLMEYLSELSPMEENTRNETINGYLSGILQGGIEPSQNADRTIADGVSSVLVGTANIPRLIAEFKKSLGEVGVGAWLGILGAVWTDKVIVQPLIGLRWFGISSTEEDKQISKNARILLALQQVLQELREFYAYVPCVTFLAKVISAEGQTKVGVGEEIVVKYVARYGKQAHEFLAREGHAPELLHYDYLPDSPNLASGERSEEDFGLRDRMSMVVMRYIPAKPSSKLSDNCRAQLKEILLKLHSEGYVFGDLRNQNILVDESESVKLIDFDWCGEYDTGDKKSLNGVPEEVREKLKGRLKPRTGPYTCYPLSISMDSVTWAKVVGPLEAILPGHDWFMLERLK
ncbi:hypothetical protein Clacol_006676 [Clathrus columnatus]|uniref:Protein kinase domain-containing protein n=1 Tax=Clathrus columnatus TaxID=1419009 RepID=A0AAV5ACQ7_9AGAM|nr:hypothetical protein Clacol_006676 [Clathrus columnatus]